MNLVVVVDYAALCRQAADRVQSLARSRPEAIIGLPTGATPLGTYRELARRVRAEGLDLSRLMVFALDEYLDVGRGDLRCLADWLEREFAGPCQIGLARVHTLDGLAVEPTHMCAEYEAAIAAAGGIDLQLLGLGPNGHAGFNEPGSRPDSRTRVVRLAPESIASNTRYWGSPEQVPHFGLTLGLGTIMEAREILLLVSGAHKARILHDVAAGPMTTAVPASLLRAHPSFTILADREAAAQLHETAHGQDF